MGTLHSMKVSAALLLAAAPMAMLSAQDAPPAKGDATSGASGRGVRVIAPDAPTAARICKKLLALLKR